MRRRHAATSSGIRRNDRSSSWRPFALARANTEGRHRAGMPRDFQFETVFPRGRRSSRATSPVPPNAAMTEQSSMSCDLSHPLTSFKDHLRLITEGEAPMIRLAMARTPKPAELRFALGSRIALVRRANGLKQEQMAAAIGVARNTLAMWEIGARTADLNAVIRISGRFNVSLDYLYKGSLDALGDALRQQIIALEAQQEDATLPAA